MPSVTFVIDAHGLMRPSGKPKHLEARFRNRHSHQCTGSVNFAQLRKERLTQRLLYVQSVVESHQTEWNTSLGTRKQKLQASLEKATRNRVEHLQRQVEMYGNAVAHAKKVALLKKHPSAELAVLKVQFWWRRLRLAPHVRHFKKMRLSLETAKTMSFDELVGKIQSDVMIKAVGRLLVRVKKLSPTPITHWKTPGRVFLSAFMVHLFPKETIQTEDSPLIQLALDMLTSFESWLKNTRSHRLYSLMRQFLEDYMSYHDAFEAWKHKDSMKVVDELISHWMDLERLWLSVVHQEDAPDQWAPRIQQQQKHIFTRIARFGPSALEKLESVRQQEKDARLSSMTQEERDTLDISDISLKGTFSPQVYRSAIHAHRRRDSVSPMGSPKSQKRSSTPAMNLSQYGQAMSNEQLAHELIVNPDFSLKPTQKSALEEQVSEMAKKAFFDTVKQELEQGVYGNHVLNLISDMKKSLLSMVNDKGSLYQQINDVLDMELIKQQIDKSAFNLEHYLTWICEKMLTMCAPVRDKDIRSLISENDSGIVLRRIMEILDDMKMDLANFHLQSLKPHLQQQAIEYEQTKFNQALSQGSVSLEKTKEWLKSSVGNLQDVVSSRNPDNVEHPDLTVRYTDAFNNAMLSLIFSTQTLDDVIPETLIMDAQRLFEFQNEQQALTIVASLIMLSKNIVPELRNHERGVQKLKDTLLTLLQEPNTSIDSLSLHIISSINTLFKEHADMLANLKSNASIESKTLTPEQETLIKTMVDKTVSFKDPVYSLLNRRMQATIKSHMEKQAFKKTSLSSHGLDMIGDELEKLSLKIVALAQHNRQVYVQHYDTILKALI